MTLVMGTLGTEVLAVNHATRSIHLVVNMDCRPDELKLPERMAEAEHKVQFTCRYLVEEGFLPRDKCFQMGWHTHIGVVAKRK